MEAGGSEEALLLGALAAWLDAGAPDDRPPELPEGLDPALLGGVYERHLLCGRRERGAYYTPRALTQPLCEAVLRPLLAPEEPPRVLDPACGTGAFLLEAARLLLQCCGDPSRWLDRLLGLDSDGAAVAIARLALAHLLGVPLGRVRGLRRADTLREPGMRSGEVDVILGNPPFLGEEDHGAQLRLLRGGSPVGPYLEARTDCAFLFAHLSLDLLREGGRLGLVLPEGLLSASGAGMLRRRLVLEARIESITEVALPGGALFPGAPGQRCALLVLRKQPAPDHRPEVARLDERGWRVTHLAPPQRELLLPGGRLRLAPPSAEEICLGMERIGVPLGEHFTVDTGIQAGPSRLGGKALRRLPTPLPGAKSGAGVFVLSDEEIAALELSAAERALLRPFYFAGELTYGALPPPRHQLLYLTQRTCPDLRPYPALRRHLERFRPVMEQRRETRLGYRTYFQLHWPRREELFLDPKLLSVRQALRPIVVLAERAAFVDLAVNVITARPDAGPAFSLRALCALLRSAPVHHYLHHRGKRKGAVLQIDEAPLLAVPLPAYDQALDVALSKLADAPGATEQIEALTAAAYALQRVPRPGEGQPG